MLCRFVSFSKENRLRELSAAVQHCTLCSRLSHRIKVLSEANGDINSKVMFVAEAPGRLGADRTGIPLCGDKSGENFEYLLSSVGWKRSDVFVTNAVLCNPRGEDGNNSTPTAEEIKKCACYLDMTINLVDPQVIISLGATALEALAIIAPHSFRLRENVGQPCDWNGRKLIPLYHPGPRALVHRALAKQRGDLMAVAKLVHPKDGILHKRPFQVKSINTAVRDTSITPFHRIIFAILHTIGEITYFKLTKLLYLIDLTALERLGRTLTGEVYLREQEGPWPPALRKALPLLDGYEIRFIHRRSAPLVGPGPSPRFRMDLDAEALSIVAEVVEKYGRMSNSAIKTAVYLSTPMRYVLSQEATGEDMRRLPVIYGNKTVIELHSGEC